MRSELQVRMKLRKNGPQRIHMLRPFCFLRALPGNLRYLRMGRDSDSAGLLLTAKAGSIASKLRAQPRRLFARQEEEWK